MTKEELFRDILQEGPITEKDSIKGYDGRKFIDDNEFRTFVQKAIFLKSPLRQSRLLSLIGYYGKTVKDLKALDFLGTAVVENNGVQINGTIEVTGNGIRGILGDGPVTYRFVLSNEIR